MMELQQATAGRLQRKVADSTRERILDAAEAQFSLAGFQGTTVREVARESGAGLAVVTHHFSTKAVLLERVIQRRASYMAMARVNALDEVRSKSPGRPVKVQDLVKAYIWPNIERSVNGGAGWANYLLLISRLGYSQEHTALIARHFDAVSRIYLEEFRRSLPDSSDADLHHAFSFMVSAMMGFLAGSRSIEMLSQGKVTDPDVQKSFESLVRFCAAGFAATCGGSAVRID